MNRFPAEQEQYKETVYHYNTDPFTHENQFYQTCSPTRIHKIIAQYQIFKKSIHTPGCIMEFGVFKGNSLIRLLTYREMLCTNHNPHVYAFDTYYTYPETQHQPDQKYRTAFIKEAGNKSHTENQISQTLTQKGLGHNVTLIKGNILQTLPVFTQQNPQLKISFLHIDTDTYEPAKLIMQKLWPKLSKGAILMTDNYGTFPGETKAIDEHLHNTNQTIQKLPFINTPAYIQKK